MTKDVTITHYKTTHSHKLLSTYLRLDKLTYFKIKAHQILTVGFIWLEYQLYILMIHSHNHWCSSILH